MIFVLKKLNFVLNTGLRIKIVNTCIEIVSFTSNFDLCNNNLCENC